MFGILLSFYKCFFNDTKKLNILNPTVSCKATEHIQEMIDLIKTLEDKGFTYEAGGNIYFSIDKFPDYGKMALLDRQKLSAGARIEVDSNKRILMILFCGLQIPNLKIMQCSGIPRGEEDILAGMLNAVQ